MSCPLPSDFQNLIVDVNAPVCDQLRKLGLLAKTVSDAYSCIYTQNGEFTQAFINKLCASGCAGGSTDSSSTGVPGSGAAYRSSYFVGAGSYHTVFKGRVFSMDLSDWTYSTLIGDSYDVVLAMAFHPATGTLWALGVNQEAADLAAGSPTTDIPLRLGTINPSTGVFNHIADVNTAGAPWFDAGAYISYSLGLVFKADATLLFTYGTQIYTLDTSTAEATALGSGNIVDSALPTSQEPTGFHRQTDGTLVCLTKRGNLYTGTLNPTPYAPFGNAIVVTEDCDIGPHAFYRGPLKYDGAIYLATVTGDIYRWVDSDGTCGPAVIQFVAPASMANTLCAVNSPS